METFIGIDLAWRSDRNPSGAVVLRRERNGAVLVDVAPPLHSAADVLHYIAAHDAGRDRRACVVAVDAPLVIPNATGQRACERQVGQRYGARDASCHTSNRTLYPDASSVALAAALTARGYQHAVAVDHPWKHRSLMLEVYPHAAMVALYDLPRIVKYKKGTLADKRGGLEYLRTLLGLLTRHDPPVLRNDALRALLRQPLDGLTTAGLKHYEDALDALICAYVGYHYYAYAGRRTEVFGDADAGYIANPRLQPDWLGAMLAAAD